MNIERQYIEKALEDMKERLEFVKEIKSDYEESVKEHEVGSFESGLYKGSIIAFKTEIEFLERKIKFLSGALTI